MFKIAVSSARPASRSLAPQIRTFSSTLRSLNAKHDDHALEGKKELPLLFGPGGKAGEVPSDFQQATGLERLQMLGEMAGTPAFDPNPLDASRIGTKKNPILVLSYAPERLIGCTGSPAGSHEVHWYNCVHEKQTRCLECGSVYQLDFDAEMAAEAAKYVLPEILRAQH